MTLKNLRFIFDPLFRFAEANDMVSAPGNGNQSNVLALSKQKFMKESMLLLVTLFIFTSVTLMAQSPQKINFQSIVRNTNGLIVSNKTLSIKISLLSDSITGTQVYSESHAIKTDAIGLVSLQIGSGTALSGSFATINWGNASHFIKLEADFNGGNNYVLLGTQELMSVPYAMYAAKTDTASLNLTNRFAAKAPINNPQFTGTVGGITKAMVDGLENVENTSDEDKPVSSATQTALAAKAPINNPQFTGTVGGITKAMVDGLENVENTSDANKRVSTATQTALALKAPISSPTFTGTVVGITKAMVGLDRVENTSDEEKRVSEPTLRALNEKAPVNNPTFTGTVSGIDKSMVGLDRVENTSDEEKRVSEPTQTALDLKLNKSDFPSGNNRGEFMYWNGDYWTILPPGQRGQSIIIDQEGNPTWDCLIPNTVDTTMSNLGQTLVVNTPITPIRIRTTGVTGISEQNLNLPQGLEASWSANVITILGTPTQAGNRDFSIYLEVSCGEPLSVTGLIDVSAVAPDAPTNVVATAGDGSASVAFVAPTNNGGIDITEYTVTSNPGSFTQTGTTSPITVSGLTNGTSYTFTVIAVNVAGPSIASARSAPVTPAPAATVPDAPTGVVATAGNTSASVAFVAPSNNGGSEIDGYRVTSNPGGFSSFGATSPLNVTGLTNGTPYTFTVAAKNLVGPSIESAPSAAVTPAAPPVCPGSQVIDANANIYNTVAIGTQCWMQENLRTRLYNDSTAIRFDKSGTSTGSVSQTWSGTGLNYGAYTLYAHDSVATPSSNLSNYGYLYNWYAAKGIITDGGQPTKNICPTGWHVPTNSDWNKLVKSIDSDADTSLTAFFQSYTAGSKMKSTGTDYWLEESAGTNNSSRFSALPGGQRERYGIFSDIRNLAIFWSATETGSFSNGMVRILSKLNGNVAKNNYHISIGLSVRCLKD